MDEQKFRIRNLINTSIMRALLSKNIALWNQLCSSLDFIEDTELAIAAYCDREFGESDGAHYLAVYGLLQALFIQQDAVRHLCESLEMLNPLDNNPKLEKIRDIRNDTIGHPTKRDRKKGQPTSHNFIARYSLKNDRLEVMSVSGNETPRFADISIPNIIAEQKTCLSEILTSVISELEKKEKAHKENFRMEKLASLFPTTLGYSFQKIFGGITQDPRDIPLGAWGVSAITKTLRDFREALTKRGVSYESVNYECELLEYPLTELEAFFQNVQNNEELNINEKTAFIFASFVEKQIDELISMAKEIDKDYSG